MNEQLILPFTFNTQLGLVVILLPFLSFVVTALWPVKNKITAFIGTALLSLSFIIALVLFYDIWNQPAEHTRWVWFRLGEVQFTAGIWLNNLSVLLLVLVTLVSVLVHLFSIEYMKGDKSFNRYFAFLGLFTFSMLGIILADNLLLIFVFWELVGLSSYLLIGFWFHKESAVKASKKAFIVNRIGDLGFLIGILLLWNNYHTLDISSLNAIVELSDPMMTVAALCLFGGVVGKSAQFPLLVWLPDAMEGPTPVSALIHAATMVAAGVFLLARVANLLPIESLEIIALIGAITAFMGGVAALRQFDIKKILAFSTISQLGYMVMGVGVGASDAAIFHLITHGFFKASLFLSAGVIIHSLHQYAHDNNIEFDAQDIRLMGGLRAKMPFVFKVFLFACLALIGMPLFSGFLSKEAILIAASSHTNGWQIIVPLLGFSTVILTAFYVVRLLLIVFFGNNRLMKVVKIEKFELPDISLYMKVPLVVLSIGSFFFLFSMNPFIAENVWILKGLGVAPTLPHNSFVSIISILFLLIGGGVAFQKFKPQGETIGSIHEAPNFRNPLQSLSFHNWHLDAVYNALFIQPTVQLAQGIKRFERKILDQTIDSFAVLNVVLGKIIGWADKYIVDGLVHVVAFLNKRIGSLARSIQSGKAQTHIAWASIAVIVIVIWLVL